MNNTTDAFLYLINLAEGFLAIIFIARLWFQWASVPMYNPIALFVAKFTEPVVARLRFLPTIARFNFAALAVIIIIDFLGLILTMAFSHIVNPVSAILLVVLQILPIQLLNFIFWSLILNVILSWLPNANFQPLAQAVNSITAPILQPIRRVLPTTSGLDFAPVVALVAIRFLELLIN